MTKLSEQINKRAMLLQQLHNRNTSAQREERNACAAHNVKNTTCVLHTREWQLMCTCWCKHCKTVLLHGPRVMSNWQTFVAVPSALQNTEHQHLKTRTQCADYIFRVQRPVTVYCIQSTEILPVVLYCTIYSTRAVSASSIQGYS
jgi:hypothetical protein